MAESLTEEEKGVLGECLWAASQGPFFVNFWGKSQPLLGATRDEIAAVAKEWPQREEDDADTCRAINNALFNLLRHPHRRLKEWERYISVSEAEAGRIFHKWRKLQDARLAKVKASRVPTSFTPTSALRVPHPPIGFSWASMALEGLRRREVVRVRTEGDDMQGRIDDGDIVALAPCAASEVTEGDIVLARITEKGSDASAHGECPEYLVLHLVWDCSEQRDRFLIGNNYGTADGWIDAENIFGKVTQIDLENPQWRAAVLVSRSNNDRG